MQLNIQHLNKSYGKKLVLQDINLAITDEPRLIALIAPNGSGKTTLLNIICNLEKADSGSVTVFDLPNNHIEIFENLTFMQDNSVLYQELTGMDHLQLVENLHQLNHEQVMDVLDNLKMTDYIHKQVKHYSLGMKQHLLFALSILPKPKILLMDEPLNGLDPASVVRVRNILLKLHQEGTTIIFSSHNLDQIDKLTDDIYFMLDQQLVALAELSTRDDEKKFELITTNANEFYQLIHARFAQIEVTTKHKCVIHCPLSEMAHLASEFPSHILEYQEISESLEKIYFKLYEDFNDEAARI